MFAGAQGIDGVVRACAEIVTWLGSADGYPVGRLTVWVRDFEIREYGFVAKVLECVRRFASILTTKGNLPIRKGHALRFAGVGDFLGLCFEMGGGFHGKGSLFLFCKGGLWSGGEW